MDRPTRAYARAKTDARTKTFARGLVGTNDRTCEGKDG